MSQDRYYALEDTIAAIATPVGAGGIGIVRLSGPAAKTILRALWLGGQVEPRRMCYGHICDPELDQVDEDDPRPPRSDLRQFHGRPELLHDDEARGHADQDERDHRHVVPR